MLLVKRTRRVFGASNLVPLGKEFHPASPMSAVCPSINRICTISKERPLGLILEKNNLPI